MTDKMKIRAGAQLTFVVERSDPSAISATFIAQFTTTVITETVLYDVNGDAFFEFGEADTSVVGTYNWQVNENFATGSPDKYPVLEGGKFPTLYIYESLDEE